MRAERLGSYSRALMRPTTPSLLRLKSMMRYSRLWPPPRLRIVIRPWLLRPAFFFSGSVSDFSGRFFASPSVFRTVIDRRAGLVGLNVLTAMVRIDDCRLTSDDCKPGRQNRHL